MARISQPIAAPVSILATHCTRAEWRGQAIFTLPFSTCERPRFAPGKGKGGDAGQEPGIGAPWRLHAVAG
jgi:hypothetical protein